MYSPGRGPPEAGPEPGVPPHEVGGGRGWRQGRGAEVLPRERRRRMATVEVGDLAAKRTDRYRLRTDGHTRTERCSVTTAIKYRVDRIRGLQSTDGKFEDDWAKIDLGTPCDQQEECTLSTYVSKLSWVVKDNIGFWSK